MCSALILSKGGVCGEVSKLNKAGLFSLSARCHKKNNCSHKKSFFSLFLLILYSKFGHEVTNKFGNSFLLNTILGSTIIGITVAVMSRLSWFSVTFLVSVGNGLLTDRYFTATFQVKSGVGFGYFAQCRVNCDAFTGMVWVHENSAWRSCWYPPWCWFYRDRTFGNKRVATLASGLSMAFTWSGRMIVASPSYKPGRWNRWKTMCPTVAATIADVNNEIVEIITNNIPIKKIFVSWTIDLFLYFRRPKYKLLSIKPSGLWNL